MRTLPILRRWRPLLAAPLAIALAGLVGAPAPVAFGGEGCSVRNATKGTTHASLQAAADGASRRDLLLVRGQCTGGTVIRTSLTIEGRTTSTSGAPGLYGGASERVLRIAKGRTVTIRDLEIAFGYAGEDDLGGAGAGIYNEGRLTLVNVVVANNDAVWDGGGIANTGTLVLAGRTAVHTNVAWFGGGIFSTGPVTLRDRARIRDNTSAQGGGIFLPQVEEPLTLTMLDRSVVKGNDATAYGGGIFVQDHRVVIAGHARVRNNEASLEGGGIWAIGTEVIVTDDARVLWNEATTGGGVYLRWYGDGGSGSLRLARSSRVGANQSTDAEQGISGILIVGADLVMTGSSRVDVHTSPAIGVVGIVNLGDGDPGGPRTGTFTMRDSSEVTENFVNADGAAVVRLSCEPSVPVTSGLKSRVVFNSPANVKTICLPG